MSQATLNNNVSTRELVEEAKRLVSQGYIQEALDMTNHINNVQVQAWRNKLQLQLAQQKVLKKQHDGLKQKVFLVFGVTIIAVSIILGIIIASRSKSQDPISNSVIMVTRTLTPDIEATELRATGLAQAHVYMQQLRATQIANGTPCFSECPDGYIMVTLTPNN